MDNETLQQQELLIDELVDLNHECDVVKELWDKAIETDNVLAALTIHGMLNVVELEWKEFVINQLEIALAKLKG
jgi:hypothetical protein